MRHQRRHQDHPRAYRRWPRVTRPNRAGSGRRRHRHRGRMDLVAAMNGLLFAALLLAQTNEPQAGMRSLARQFADYTILLAAAPDEPWRASWNDPGQMAMFENPTNS